MKSLRAALLTVAFAACSAAPTEGPSAVPAPASSSVTVIETRRTFEQEQAALAKRRSVVATGEITALEAAGNRVTWAELAGTELKLHSLEDGVAAILDYDFPAGDLFHVSRALVVTEQAIESDRGGRAHAQVIEAICARRTNRRQEPISALHDLVCQAPTGAEGNQDRRAIAFDARARRRKLEAFHAAFGTRYP